MNETKNSKENRVQVNTIENKWTNLVEAMKSIPTSDTKKKLKTEIISWKLSSLLFTLMGKINNEKTLKF